MCKNHTITYKETHFVAEKIEEATNQPSVRTGTFGFEADTDSPRRKTEHRLFQKP